MRVRLDGCGVCPSSLPLYEGRPWFDYPREPGQPGHEGWGILDAVGAGVHGRRAGERVAFLSERAFAEYDLADASAVVPLPDGLAGRPFPGEPLACAFNVFRRSGIGAGDLVAVVGIGFLGAVVTRLAHRAGARVVAISRRTSSLELAERFGAEQRLRFDSDRVPAEIERLSQGRLCDRVIECVGEQAPLDLASRLVRVRGRLVIAGYHQDGARSVDLQLWNWQGIDVVNAHERAPEAYVEGLEEAVAAVRDGELELDALLTRSWPLSALGEALRTAGERPAGFVKGWVEA